ncbi:MAG: polysaccharide biosynthesis tyrosine autokinase [Vicinamibacteria bacterium]
MNEERFDVVPGLRREWMIVVRRRRLVALGLVSALVGATIYNYTLRPIYEGLSVVALAEAMAANPLARMSMEMTRLGAILERQRALIQSPEFASRVVSTLDPVAQKELGLGPMGTWSDRMKNEWAQFTGREGQDSPVDTVASFRSRLRVTGETRSTWIEIRFSAYDPKTAADIANAIMDEYLRETEASNRLAVDQTRQVLGQQVEEKEQNLNEQLSGLREMGGKSGLGDLEVRKAMLEREVRAFQEALVNAQTARVGREARRREATQLRGGVAAVRSDPLIRAAAAKVAELEDRKTTLLATLGPMHPDVITVQQQLEAARMRLAQEMGSLELGADSEYELAVNEEARLKDNMARIQKELGEVEKESLGYSLERKKVEASRNSIESLFQRQANASASILDVQPIQNARPSPVPISPQRQRNFVFSLIGGLVAGLLLAWMAERFDDSVQSPEDVKEGLGLPFLGIIPLIRKLAQGSLAPAIGDGRNGLADSLRVVRTNLIYGSAEARPKVIAFTSASPGEGKSTVAVGLAILFAQNRARVLLVDADLRRPSVHQLLGVSQSPGLSGMLSAEGPSTLVARSGGVRGLDVVTAGTPQNLSAERLGSDAMKAIIDQARGRYDWVIVDSPPALGLSDASVIATLADGIVVVCSGDKTPRQAVRHVADQLRAVRAVVLGVVLNRVDLHRHSYYYGRYYSPYYGVDADGGRHAAEPRESPTP